MPAVGVMWVGSVFGVSNGYGSKMKIPLKTLSEVVASAIDLFYIKFENLDPILGIIDKGLRNQGVNAAAITIDCIALDKKVVILIHDDKPNAVGIALGNKDGDVYSSSDHAIADISEDFIMEIMEDYFVLSKNEEI